MCGCPSGTARATACAAMLFWALFASGQIALRKVDDWQTIGQTIADRMVDPAA